VTPPASLKTAHVKGDVRRVRREIASIALLVAEVQQDRITYCSGSYLETENRTVRDRPVSHRIVQDSPVVTAAGRSPARGTLARKAPRPLRRLWGP
jgi:hypothetical protein